MFKAVFLICIISLSSVVSLAQNLKPLGIPVSLSCARVDLSNDAKKGYNFNSVIIDGVALKASSLERRWNPIVQDNYSFKGVARLQGQKWIFSNWFESWIGYNPEPRLSLKQEAFEIPAEGSFSIWRVKSAETETEASLFKNFKDNYPGSWPEPDNFLGKLMFVKMSGVNHISYGKPGNLWFKYDDYRDPEIQVHGETSKSNGFQNFVHCEMVLSPTSIF